MCHSPYIEVFTFVAVLQRHNMGHDVVVVIMASARRHLFAKAHEKQRSCPQSYKLENGVVLTDECQEATYTKSA